MVETTVHEEWKPVLDFEDHYAASNRGRIKRTRGGSGCRADRIIVPRPNVWGYPSLTLSKDGKPYTRGVHRLVAEAFLGRRPVGMQVNHKDGNKKNNVLSNLEYLTPSGNQLHAIHVLGKKVTRGEECSWSKLTAVQVEEIRRESVGAPWGWITAKAKKFGVCNATIRNIRDGKRWASACSTRAS
jgi:hypothetical protein